MSGRRRRGRKKPKGAFGRIGFYKMTPVDRTAAIVTSTSAGQRRVIKTQKPKKKRWQKLSRARLEMRFKQLQQLEEAERQEKPKPS